MDRVLHVWVDPHNGNDSAPVTFNPGPSIASGNRCTVTDTHPHNVSNGSAPLLHASAPFRTVTAAVSYIVSLQSGLPHFNSVTGVTTSHVIIHCLPGVYGPGTADEPHTGLPFNGETFPIVLPGRVSIQGTSALNTVFIADGSAPIFAFGTTGNVWGPDQSEAKPRQFLANISLTGAINANGHSGAPKNGTAIWFDKAQHASVLVTDCFLYGNALGVFLDERIGTLGDIDDPANHVLYLVNNTFTWNVCGIWNGQYDPTAAGTAGLLSASRGNGTIVALNNLFDSFVPQDNTATVPMEVPLPISGGTRAFASGGSWDRWRAAITSITNTPSGTPLYQTLRMTNFEGVTADDFEVAFTSGRVDFNGFETNVFNLSNVTGALTPASIDQLTFLGLHQTRPRVANPANPSRNVATITANPTGPRGILYVRDLLHEGARSSGQPYFLAAGGTIGGESWDVCVGDFRLSPGARLGGGDRGAPPDRLNPFVDQGFAGGAEVMANGRTLDWNVFSDMTNGSSNDPTFPFVPGAGVDCEGYGNPRVYDYPLYPSGTYAGNSGTVTCAVDLGADELDQNLVAGYRCNTTTYYHRITGSTGTLLPIQANDFAWLLCPSEGLTGAAGGGTVPFTGGLFPPLHSDYLPTASWSTGAPSYYLPSYVDVIPHLLPDIHPWWTNAPHAVATNVIWQSCWTGLSNATLYVDPTVGIINPVGTYTDLGFSATWSGVFDWLDYSLLVAASAVYSGVNTGAYIWMDENGVGNTNTHDLCNDGSITGGWCYLIQNAPSVPSVTYLRPSANPRYAAGDIAMRVSAEFVAPYNPFPIQYNSVEWESRNVQTFLTLWDDQGQ